MYMRLLNDIKKSYETARSLSIEELKKQDILIVWFIEVNKNASKNLYIQKAPTKQKAPHYEGL